MDLIVAVDNNWAIGNKGDLLVSIPEDHKFFRQTTMGNVVVLGRKTLAGFPNGLPLAGRDNIIYRLIRIIPCEGVRLFTRRKNCSRN